MEGKSRLLDAAMDASVSAYRLAQKLAANLVAGATPPNAYVAICSSYTAR
jgi:hypothetical protein